MSLAATRLDEYRLAYERSNYDAWEHRMSNYGAFATFKDDTPKLIPGYDELVANRAAEVRTVSIPVINRKTSWNAASSRTCTALTGENTSAYSTPSWTTLKVGFGMYPAQYKNNYIAYQQDFNLKMLAMQRYVLETLDTAAYTHLNTNRTAVNAADGNPYTVTANSMIVPADDNDLFLNELGAIMDWNDFPSDGINVVHSPRFQALVREYSSQGISNAENRVFQFGGYNFASSNRVTVSSSAYRDTVYAIPEASLGFLSWIDPDAQMGHSSSDGKEWSVQHLPLLGIDVGLLFQSTCSDISSGSGGTGLEASLTESYHFSFDYSFISAYNSATGTYAGPIFKADLVK